MTGGVHGLTIRGRCLLAAGAATAASAVILDERDLLRVGIFVALLPLLALALVAGTRRAVRVARTVSPARAPVGTSVEVVLHVTGGPLIGALRLVDAAPDAAGPDADTPARFTVHRLSARTGALLSYPLRPVQRGVHRIGPLSARATDPLGLAEFEREIAEPSRLITLPRLVPLRGVPRALGSGEGMPGAALAHPGQGRSDVLVRPYQQGDELRRVHWRSTARHDELMVRLEERPWRSTSTVLLDRRDRAHRGRGPGSSLESAVSLAAGICTHLARRGDAVTLVGEDSCELASVAGDVEPMLDTLAALRPVARIDLAGPALDGDVVAILGSVGSGQLTPLLARLPAGGHAVLLDVATWAARHGTPGEPVPPVGPTAAALRQAGWTVAVARAGDRPDRAWDELVGGGGR